MSMRSARTDGFFRRSAEEPNQPLLHGAHDGVGDDAHPLDEPSILSVLEASGVGYWQLDRDDGRLQCSTTVKTHLGLDRDDDLPSYDALRQCVHVGDRTAMDETFAKVVTGEAFVVDVRALDRSGELRWLIVRGSAHASKIAGTMVDVTAHRVAETERERLLGELASQRARLDALVLDREKRAEAALRDSESRLRRLFTSPVTGMFSSHVDGRITDANDEFLRMVGYTREDLTAGKLSWRAMTPPELRDADDIKLHELLATGSHLPFEKEYVRKDGSRIPILLGSTMVEASESNVFTIALDMSEKKQAERERESLLASLERSEERYRLAALATNDVIWDWDIDSNLVNFRSMMFESDPASLTCGEEWLKRIHPSDRERVLDGRRAAVEDGARHWQDEYRLRKPDGSWMTIFDRGYVARDANGRALWMVGASRDVTIQRRQQEFERQLIGIVSHDLKNPLQTIMLAAELLTRASDVGADSSTNIRRIRRAAERAHRMVRDLLDFTRARVGAGIPVERRPVRLDAVVSAVVDEARAGHPDRPFDVAMSGELTGEFDADRLNQVVTNLVDNALRYSPPSSAIRVELRGGPDQTVLLVHNDGPPISPEVLPRIFEPLQRGDGGFDTNGRSVGLGLYIVKHLVEGHGGRISVRSSETTGTEFRIELPRATG